MRLLYITQAERVDQVDGQLGPGRITPGEDGWSDYGQPPPDDILGQIPWAGGDPNLN
jgi:hypothetical protein